MGQSTPVSGLYTQIMAHTDDVHLLIAGGGDPQRLLAFRRWPSHVHVLDAVPFAQMHALYAVADLVLMPSIVPESFSLVIYEGFQHGAPAVGAEIGAIPELIGLGDQPHVNGAGARGYLFPRGDATALADRIVCHFARPAVERRRLRPGARLDDQERAAARDGLRLGMAHRVGGDREEVGRGDIGALRKGDRDPETIARDLKARRLAERPRQRLPRSRTLLV